MYKVTLDLGHGDNDPGAVGPRLTKERDIVLQVGLKVAERLKQHSVTVALTRRGNNPGFPMVKRDNLQHRCDIANDTKADVFVSIHCDSFHDRSANGTTTFCYKKGTLAEKLAQNIQNNLISRTKLNNRGVKTANYYVLRKTHMPAALVELAFISNPREEQLLRDTAFQFHCADGVAQGILDFLGIKGGKDVDKPSNWAKEVWNWGKTNKLTDGERPKDKLTREEAIAILHSYHYRKESIK